MKTFAIVAATLLASTPFVTASAAVLDPIVYGTTFCQERRNGTTYGTATERAVLASIDQNRNAIKLSDGVDLDVALSSRAVQLLCPGYLSK